MINAAEYVSLGHPDSTADAIASYLLDRYLEEDPKARFALEVQLKDHTVNLAGEVTSVFKPSDAEMAEMVRAAIRKVGYTAAYAARWPEGATLNRLQWLDLLTGQNDRHWQNYFIHVDRETHKVSVKGIDNDAGYSQYRTGAVKYTFDERRSLTFMSQLKALAKKIDPRNVDAEYQHLLKDRGITFDEKSGKITVDASMLDNKVIGYALSELTGAQSLAVPDKIGRATYKALMALKQDPARSTYLNSIRPRLSTESYNAAVSRLDDVIAHADKLAEDNKIIEEDGWTNVEEPPFENGDVPVIKKNGQEKFLGDEIAGKFNVVFCPSYFTRDCIDTQFD